MPPQQPAPSEGSSVPHNFSQLVWALVLGAITVCIILYLVYITPAQQSATVMTNTGHVVILVRSSDGTRAYQSLSLTDNTLGTIPNTMQSTYDVAVPLPTPTRTTLSDDSFITISDSGLVHSMSTGSSTPTVLIASPVIVPPETPFAIWNDGEKVAWVNPADQSLQVFVKSARGIYIPAFLGPRTPPNSLVFSPDGTSIIFARITSTSTDLYRTSLSKGSTPTLLTHVPGYVTLINSYE